MRYISTDVKEKEWRESLDEFEGATIYHTPEWKKLLGSTFEYKPYYLFAENETGRIEGLLPLFCIKSKLTGERLCSVPFSHMCGPVGDGDALNALIEKTICLYKDSGASHLEIRSCIEREGFQNKNYFSTYILGLSPNIEQVWRKLDKGSVRRYIEKSRKSNLTVDTTKDIEDLKGFYELNCISKRKIGVPCHPWNFFKNLFDILGDQISLYVIKNGNSEIIAGGIMIYFKDTVIYGYGAANPNYLKLYPYHAFLWRAIDDACLNGFKYFDFGRASYDNVGLINFKKRWGTEEKRLYYGYYPNNPGSVTEKRNNLKYRFATKTIRRMPILIYKRFSDTIFGSFG